MRGKSKKVLVCYIYVRAEYFLVVRFNRFFFGCGFRCQTRCIRLPSGTNIIDYLYHFDIRQVIYEMNVFAGYMHREYNVSRYAIKISIYPIQIPTAEIFEPKLTNKKDCSSFWGSFIIFSMHFFPAFCGRKIRGDARWEFMT